MRVTDAVFSRLEPFDVNVGVCGYESRATYVSRALLESRSSNVTIDYDSAGEGDYDANKSWLERQGHDLLSEADAMAAISSARTSGHRLRIDISSMKRTTIARIVEALWENPATEPVQFVYAPALYEASSSGISNDMALQAGPVTPFFGGALRPTSTP
ncbi:MAG: hypothetical protein K0S37_1956, partial [Microbacterium sp.]|nr:hypothetical protein [Microbacterium sp.]